MKILPDPKTLFEHIPTDKPVIVAVSGGSDSIGLLLLCSAWAKHANANLQIVTVDHGLRPEAAAEAAFVAGVSEGLGHPHVTLAWEGLKPQSGVSQAARHARYQLMEEFALDIKAGVILTGHTANDQAETVLMRNQRMEGGQSRGLSGMAHTMLLPNGTQLLRPILSLTRAQLRNVLRDMQQSWVEDPSNEDETYERVRVRKRLEGQDEHVLKVCRFARVMGRYRHCIAKEASDYLKTNVDVAQGPVFSLSDQGFDDLSAPAQVLTLQVMAAIAGGANYFVSERSIQKFLQEYSERITLGNAVIETNKKGFRCYREKRNLPSVILGPKERVLWDGRILIENNSAVSYFCSALSFEQLQAIEQLKEHRLDVRPRAALGGTLFMSGDGDDLSLPFVNGFEMPVNLRVTLAVRAIEHFCPQFDFPLLEFVESLKTRMKDIKSRQI